MSADIAAAYWAMPPIARTIATAVFACSVGVYCGILPSMPFYFHWSLLAAFPPGLHRLVTSFLITGPQLGVIFDTYFLYNYLAQLERTKFARKEDLIWYLMFVGGVIIVANQLFTGAFMYLSALTIAICYTASQDLRGQMAHFYIVTIPAQLLPYCLLLVNLMMAGLGSFQLGLTGLFAAHLHDFLTRIYPAFGGGPNLIPTPTWISRFVAAAPRVTNTVYGSATAPQPRAGTGAPRAGPLPDSWRSAGPGRRLG